MTSGTRRNGFSESPLFRQVASPRYDGPECQAQDGRGIVELDGYGEYDYAPFDDTSTYGNGGFHGYQEPAAEAGYYADGARAAGYTGHETKPDRNGGRRTGRHVSGRDKTTRKRVGRVVPVAVVAATLAAGTAAYALGGTGHPQASNLNAAMSLLPSAIASAHSSRAGTANVAASAPIKIATATASDAAGASAKRSARATPSGTPSEAPSATASSATASSATPQPTHATPDKAVATAPATQAATQAATPAATTAASTSATGQSAAATTVSCNVGAGLLPANVTAIVSFLLAKGYSDNAAAGIAGNMYQESKGNPESVGDGGGGLIGWTPLPSGFITGNVTADLQTQLAAVLTYNQGWSSYLGALNSAASPADAAYIYVTDFERAGIPAASTREASAQDVASACGI